MGRDAAPVEAAIGTGRETPISARIAHEIIDGIRSGRYAVGTRLPSEQRLAAEFGVSRPSVREALCAVQFAGYVESARGSGCFVMSNEPTVAPQLATQEASLGYDPLSLLEARLVLEPAVVALGALDPHPAALRAAGQLIEGMRIALREPSVDAATDLSIHVALIETCRNPFLVQKSKQLLAIAASSVWQGVRENAWADPELLERWMKQHAELLATIREGRSADAERISREHLLSVVAHALEHPRWSPTEQSRLQDILERFGGEVSPDWRSRVRRRGAVVGKAQRG